MTDAIHILLVDDDIKNSMLLKKFLEVEEYRVTYANNGAVGWELLQTVRPDLILLDINMPEMNGFELARKIREVNRKVLIFFLMETCWNTAWIKISWKSSRHPQVYTYSNWKYD